MFCQSCGSQIDDGVKFCQSCGTAVNTITQTAPVAPTPQAGQTYGNNINAGANVNAQSSKWYIGPLAMNYSEVPFYRRRWFAVLAWLLFSPILIFIAFSGDIYALRNGEVYKEKRQYIWGILGIAGAIFLLQFVINPLYQGTTRKLPGTITITGIPAVYNGKYAVGEGFLNTDAGQLEFFVAENIDNELMNITGSQIKNGSVTLNVWEIKEDGSIARFTGSGEGMIDDLLFYNSPDPSDFSNVVGGADGKVTFTNGVATAILNFFEE